MTKRWVADIKEDPVTGDGILEFPPDMLAETGWQEGDRLVWTDNKDGSFTLTKKETQWVLVEAVSTFRERYMVEVPVGVDNYSKDKKDWALDTVTMNEAKVFSSEHLGEQIVSHRVVNFNEALNICDQDNDYTKSWDEETKIKTFFTEWTTDEKSN